MKRAVIFYSFSGNTRNFAAQKAGEYNAQLLEVKESKKRSKLAAFIPGCISAMRQKAVRLAAPLPDLDPYDCITIAAPVWAGHPAPAFNSIVQMLPQGKNVELFLISSGGSTEQTKEKIIGSVTKRNCKVTLYQDVKR